MSNVNKLKEEINKLKEEVGKLNKLKEEVTKLNKLKESFTKLQEEKTEVEKKLAKITSVLATAKTKLQTMKDMNEKLTTERLEMKKKLSSSEQASNGKQGAVLVKHFKSEIDFDLWHCFSHCMSKAYKIWHICSLKACSNSR